MLQHPRLACPTCHLPAADGQAAATAAAKVPVVDTVGAGDFFTSGCLYGLLSGASLKVRCKALIKFVSRHSVDSAAAKCNLCLLPQAPQHLPCGPTSAAAATVGCSGCFMCCPPSIHRHARSAAALPAQRRSRRRVRSLARKRCSGCAQPLLASLQPTGLARQAAQRRAWQAR